LLDFFAVIKRAMQSIKSILLPRLLSSKRRCRLLRLGLFHLVDCAYTHLPSFHPVSLGWGCRMGRPSLGACSWKFDRLECEFELQLALSPLGTLFLLSRKVPTARSGLFLVEDENHGFQLAVRKRGAVITS